MAQTTRQAVKVMAAKEGKYLIFSLLREEYGIGILKIKEINGFPILSGVKDDIKYLDQRIAFQTLFWLWMEQRIRSCRGGWDGRIWCAG